MFNVTIALDWKIMHSQFYTVKVRGFACQAKKKDIRQFFAGLKLDSVRLPPKVKGVAYVGFASEKAWKNALNKNRSFHGIFKEFFRFVTLEMKIIQ